MALEGAPEGVGKGTTTLDYGPLQTSRDRETEEDVNGGSEEEKEEVMDQKAGQESVSDQHFSRGHWLHKIKTSITDTE